MTKKLLAIIILILAILISLFLIYPKQTNSLRQKLGSTTHQLAALFFVDTVTIDLLQNKYQQSDADKKIKILIVPGHEPTYGGAEYQGLLERDLNLQVAEKLASKLRANPKYEVTLSRDQTSWNPELKNYLDTNWNEIKKWRDEQKALTRKLIINGQIRELTDSPQHGKTQTNPALRLYGINKWASAKDFDIALNLHLNDDAAHRYNQPGRYRGFAIYVPFEQYSNAKAAREIANDIFARLKSSYQVSNLDQEKNGVVEDQKLIALGRYNTADTASLLIEYGYIYEPKFADPNIRNQTLTDLAEKTYLGLEDFFKTKTSAGSS